MTETRQAFNDRREADEKALAGEARKSERSIPHGQLSKHQAAEAPARQADPLRRETALDGTVVSGSVVISLATREATSLARRAAGPTSDRLFDRAREVASEATVPRTVA